MALAFKLGNKKNANDIIQAVMNRYTQSRMLAQRQPPRQGTPSGMSLEGMNGQVFQNMRNMNPQQTNPLQQPASSTNGFASPRHALIKQRAVAQRKTPNQPSM